MVIQISNVTLKRTTRCMSSFRCLNDETRNVCTVDRCIQDDFCFLKDEEPHECFYITPFGYSFICSCPTRSEIYRRYRI